jgi:ankyrin repeat protein
MTPLHFAVQNSNLDMVNLLLHFHANPNLKNSENETPLSLALRFPSKNHNIVDSLERHGAEFIISLQDEYKFLL